MFLYTIDIKLSSKKINQLKQFLIILKFYKIKYKLNLKLFMLSNFQLNKKKISVLKSPHVHKKAQEQYSLNLNTLFFKILSNLSLKKLTLFLNSFNFLFVDVFFKKHFKFFFKRRIKKNKNYFLSNFSYYNSNPNNFLVVRVRFLSSYMKIINNFGELKLSKYLI